MKRGIVKCLYERTKHLTTKPSVISEEKKTRVTANKETVQEFKSTAVLLYIKGCIRGSSPLPTTSRHTVFEFETTLRSHLVRPKDALELTKQNGFVCKIPCECSKVYIGETGRSMRERIKEHDWHSLLVLRPLRFWSTLMKRGIFLFGARLTLLIVTLTGTHVGSKRLSI